MASGSIQRGAWRFVVPPPTQAAPRSAAPSFSVLIGAYQAASTVGEAVESALSQTSPAFEIVVCNDGSTDDIETVLAPYRDRIIYIRKENGGGASALNAAARAASAEFVVVLDADDAYLPRRLEGMGALAAERPDLDILATDVIFEFEGREVGLHNSLNPFDVRSQRTTILERSFFSWPAVRRQRLLEIGGFAESLRIAYDWDCWIRLLYVGCQAGLVDEPLMRYRISRQSLSGQRVATLRERVAVLEKTAATLPLSGDERAFLERSLTRQRRRALLAEAEEALRTRAPDARQRSLAVAVGRGFGARSRAKAALAAIAPASAGRWLERRAARTGDSRLVRPVPGEG